MSACEHRNGLGQQTRKNDYHNDGGDYFFCVPSSLCATVLPYRTGRHQQAVVIVLGVCCAVCARRCGHRAQL